VCKVVDYVQVRSLVLVMRPQANGTCLTPSCWGVNDEVLAMHLSLRQLMQGNSDRQMNLQC
jgi:hypothetical protein